MGSIRTPLIGACMALLVTGCFAVADLDRFHGPRGTTSGGGITGYSSAIGEDLIVALGDVAPERLELRVIDSNERVVAATVVDTIGPDDRELVVPDLVPTDGTATRLDILVHRAGVSSTFRVAFDRLSRASGSLRVDLDEASSL